MFSLGAAQVVQIKPVKVQLRPLIRWLSPVSYPETMKENEQIGVNLVS